MAEERSGADIGVKIGGQEVNVRNIKSLNTILTALSLVMSTAIGVFLWGHVDASKELVKEIRDGNRAQQQGQKNSNYYQCMQVCLLAQGDPAKRNPQACELQCAPVKQ